MPPLHLSCAGRPVPTADRMTRILIGIDDTDNLDSPGTGMRSRELGHILAAEEIATVHGITRHQLLFDPRIPYTSHNSSLCLDAEILGHNHAAVAECCRQFLLANSAPGSDAGLCIGAWDSVTSAVENFGRRAKAEILTMADAHQLARAESLLLEGLTGDHGGQIGALAAVGLRRSNKDGRVAWARGIREATGIFTLEALLRDTGINAVTDLDGHPVPPGARIDVTPWPRAVLIDGQVVLLVQPGEPHADYDWCNIPKAIRNRH
jgi:hypothetical protein